MTYPTDEELNYTDITWFAADSRGRVAVFFSCGTNNIIKTPATTEEGGDAIFNYIEGRPVVTGPILTIKPEGEYEVGRVEVEYAEKGLYVYSAARHATLSPNKYIRIVKPQESVLLPDLDESIASLLRTIQGESIDFDEARILNILDITTEITDRDGD